MTKTFADALLEKVKADYDRIAADFSATRTALWPELLQFKAFAKPGDRVLDAGCGNGRVYQLFAGMAIDYEGIDASENLIAIAKEKWRDPLAHFRAGSILSIPFEDESFDVVLAVAALHHVPSDAYRLQSIAECRRVLKPGGRLLMTNWARWKPQHWSSYVIGALQSLLRLRPYDIGDVLVSWDRGEKADRYVHVFTKSELARLARHAGFTVERLDYVVDGESSPAWKAGNMVAVVQKPFSNMHTKKREG